MRLTNVLISPLVVCLSLSCLLAQSTDESSPPDVNRSAITGRVVARGKPLEGAVITLWRQSLAEPTESNRAGTTRTDSAGNYELTDVPTGKYFISATANGFVTGKENQIFLNLRHVIVIAGRSVDGINFELMPEGVIKGTVTDADGKPVARTPIKIFPEGLSPSDSEPLYARDLHTDDQGMFRVSGLPAGRYRLAAGYQPVVAATFFRRAGYRRTFYPEGADEAEASVIEIAPGSEVTDVNINLGRPVKTFSVSAKVVASQSGEPIQDIDYGLDVYSNGKRIGGVQNRNRSNSRGEILIENVPPGEYSIRVPAGRGSLPAGEIPPAPNLFGESKHFEVTDRNVDAIEIRTVKAATASGFVVIEGPVGMDILARVLQMRLMAMVQPKPGSVSPIITANIKPDGSFTFTGLRPGKLRFSFVPPSVGRPLPLRFVRTERDGVKLDQDPEIEAGDQITGLRLVLAYDGGSIQGLVKFTNESLPANAKLIARAFLGKEPQPIGSAVLDRQGQFLIQGLAPGEYRLLISILGSPSPLAEQKVIVSEKGNPETIVLFELSSHAIPK